MQEQTMYGDKEILADALASQKDTTKMYNMVANECANPQLRTMIMDMLNQEHDMQFDVFQDMSTRGFYPVTPATQGKINACKKTFEPSVQM